MPSNMQFAALLCLVVCCQTTFADIPQSTGNQRSCSECMLSMHAERNGCPPKMMLAVDSATGCPIATCNCVPIEESLNSMENEMSKPNEVQAAPPTCQNDCSKEGYCQSGYEFALNTTTKCSKRPCECVLVGSSNEQPSAVHDFKQSTTEPLHTYKSTTRPFPTPNPYPPAQNNQCNIMCFCPQQYDVRQDASGCPIYPCQCIPRSNPNSPQYPYPDQIGNNIPATASDRCGFSCSCPQTYESVLDETRGCPKLPCECTPKSNSHSNGNNYFGSTNPFANFGWPTVGDDRNEKPSSGGDDLFETTSDGQMLEGDMLIPPSQINQIRSLYRGVTDYGGQRVAQNIPGRLWTQYKRGNNYYVPYEFSGISSTQQRSIEAALDDYRKYTCIRFVRRSNERDYINVASSSGCYSMVGKVGGRQSLSLQSYGCTSKGTILHEFMHALGFFHEQSRSDRDNYIRINTGNIRSGAQRNFEKRLDGDNLGVSYDYNSVMHYRLNAFSRNGQNTITPLRYNGNPSSIGNVDNLSKLDIRQINKLYRCDTTGNPDPSNPPPGTTASTPGPWSPWTRPTTKPSRTTTTKRPRTRTTKRPKPTTPSEDCRDFYMSSTCGTYKRYGYCERSIYRHSMERYCKKTCGFCNGGGGGGFTPPTPFTFPTRPTRPPSCLDLAGWSCQYLTRNGACDYQSTVQRYCQRSCDLC